MNRRRSLTAGKTFANRTLMSHVVFKLKIHLPRKKISFLCVVFQKTSMHFCHHVICFYSYFSVWWTLTLTSATNSGSWPDYKSVFRSHLKKKLNHQPLKSNFNDQLDLKRKKHSALMTFCYAEPQDKWLQIQGMKYKHSKYFNRSVESWPHSAPLKTTCTLYRANVLTE